MVAHDSGPRDIELLEDLDVLADSTFDIWSYFQVLIARRWLIVSIGVIFGTYGVYTAIREVPVYTASARILIEPPPAAFGLNDLLGRNRPVEVDQTQLQLLESRNFKIQVATNYGLLPADAAASAEDAGGAADAAASNAADATSEAATPGQDIGLVAAAGAWASGLVDRVRTALAPPTGNRLDPAILPEYMRQDRYGSALRQFRAMRVSSIENTNLVDISWTSRDRVVATRMANAVAAEFVAYSRNHETKLSTDANAFLTQEIQRLQAEIQNDEQQVMTIAGDLGVPAELGTLDPSGSGRSALSGQLAAAVADRVHKESLYRQAQDAEPGSLAEVRNDDNVRQARARLGRFESQLAEESKRLTAQHPTIRGLEQEVAEARQDLEEREQAAYDAAVLTARSAYDAAVQAAARLQEMVAGQRTRSAEEADDYARLAVLRTSIANKQRALQQFVAQRETMDLNARMALMREATVRVADWATLPQVPSGQPLSRAFFFNAMIGALLGCAIALGLDFLNNTLRTADDVQRRIGLPTLGTVTSLNATLAKKKRYPSSYSSYSKDSQAVPEVDPGLPAELVAHQQSRSMLAEEYRVLRTALLLSSAGGAPRRLLVTSALPGEGKTTTISNLAISLAQAGKTILVVDGDMRRPSLAEIFGKSEETPGLANYLAGSAPWKEMTLNTDVEKLWLLPSGPVPPNPAELFVNDLYGQMVTEALEIFDMVLVDSPPLEPVVDTLLLAQHADSVILVVRAGSTTHYAVSRARRKLEQVRARLLGIVLTQIQRSDHGDAYYPRRGFAKAAAIRAVGNKSGKQAAR